MKTKIYLSAICALAINVAASDLGTIQVESSTIDDKFESTKTEVSSVAIITEAEIEKLNPKSIIDVLNTIPGLTASKVGTDTVKVHIRGVGNHLYMGEQPGVAVVIDGVPVQETTGKINVDLDNIASIKVIKGGASYLFGNDALAGAVIITTKRTKGRNSSKAEIEAGSFDSLRMLASTNQSFENSALQLQVTSRETDGYWDDAWLEHKSINGKYNYYIDDSSDIIFGLDYTTRKTGDGNSVKGVTMAEENPTSIGYVSYSAYYDTSLIKGFTTYSKNFEDGSNIMVSLYSYLDNTENYSTPDRTTRTYHTRFNDEEWIQNGIKSEYRKSFNNFAVMGGIDIQRNSVKSLSYDTNATKIVGSLRGNSNTDEDVNAIYIELKNQLSPSLSLTLNARYDNIVHDYSDDFNSSLNVNPSYNALSYRAGLNYKVNSNHNVYTSISTGFKAPTASQISTNQEGVSLGDIISGDLDIETTYNYEIGAIGKVYGLNYGASIYQLDRVDYIGVKAGSYNTRAPDDDGETYYGNLGDMRSRGFELSLNSNKQEVLAFGLAYTYLDATFTSYSLIQDGNVLLDLSGNDVPRTPKHTINLIVDYRPIPELTISPELMAKSSYYADELNKYKQDGYEIVNLRAIYKLNPQLEFFASIDNLLDKSYYEFVTVYSNDSTLTMEDATIRVAPGRAYYAGLRAKF